MTLPPVPDAGIAVCAHSQACFSSTLGDVQQALKPAISKQMDAAINWPKGQSFGTGRARACGQTVSRSGPRNSKTPHLRRLWTELQGFRQRKDRADAVDVVCGRASVNRHGNPYAGLPLFGEKEADTCAHRCKRQNLSAIVEAPD